MLCFRLIYQGHNATLNVLKRVGDVSVSQNVAGCRKRGSEAPAFRRGERHT